MAAETFYRQGALVLANASEDFDPLRFDRFNARFSLRELCALVLLP